MINSDKKWVPLLMATLFISGQTQADTPTQKSKNTTFQTITVSARGVEEDSFETPFSVEILDGYDVQEQGLTTVKSALINQVSAGSHNGGNVAYDAPFMRGIGTFDTSNFDDNTVDFRIDGVSNGKMGMARNLIDIDRVEIAKGPQGTLLGSQALAGSISVKTVDPQDEFDARLGFGVGNLNQKNVNGMVNAPLSENLALRVAGMAEQKDSHLVKKEDGKPITDKERKGIQAKLGWHDDSYANEVVLGLYQDESGGNVPLMQLDNDDASGYKIATANLPHSNDSKAQGLTLNVKSQLGFADFTSVTGYHKFDNTFFQPLVEPEFWPVYFGSYPQVIQSAAAQYLSVGENNNHRFDDDFKQTSQEFRLSSTPESQIKWVAGLSFNKKDRDFTASEVKTIPAPTPTGQATLGDTFYNNSKGSAQAVFGELTYPVTEKLDLIAGARVTREELEHSVRVVPLAPSMANPTAEVKSDSKKISETNGSGRLGISYEVSPNVRLYALQSKGHKLGGFGDYDREVANGREMQTFKSAKIDATELGLKTHNSDQSVNVGIAVFQNKVKDEHIKFDVNPGTYNFIYSNIDTASKGFELDADWQVNDSVKLYSDLAMTQSKITDAPQSLLAQGKAKIGNDMAQTPRFSGRLGVQYRNGLSLWANGQWFVDVNYRHIGSRYSNASNDSKLGAYHLINAQLGAGNEHHSVTLWGQNLTDEKYKLFDIYSFKAIALGEGRTFGVNYAYQF